MTSDAELRAAVEAAVPGLLARPIVGEAQPETAEYAVITRQGTAEIYLGGTPAVGYSIDLHARELERVQANVAAVIAALEHVPQVYSVDETAERYLDTFGLYAQRITLEWIE